MTFNTAAVKARWEQIIEESVAQTVAAFDCTRSGRHVWWTEQQTGHTRCAYCDTHPVKGENR